MAMHKCSNCVYEGDEVSVKPLPGKCPVCGDNFVEEIKSSAKEEIVEKESVMDKVKDVVDDLLDDGKLNNSNKKKRGRGKKQ